MGAVARPGAPLALVVSVSLFGLLGHDVPQVAGRFWPIIAGAGVAQIGATVALLVAFKFRDFAIGTVYAKGEVLIVAALGALGLGAGLSPAGWLGAVVVTAGVASLASMGSPGQLLRRSIDPAALCGLGAGAGFALAAVGIGAASRALSGAPSFDRAVLTLTALLVFQAVANALWLAATEPAALGAVARAWRPAAMVGALSLLGSLGWTWAFTLESAAKVRTLGQVELIIAFVVGRITLGERHSIADLAASTVVLGGVVMVTVLG